MARKRRCGSDCRKRSSCRPPICSRKYARCGRGSELSVHFNWISGNNPGRTLTRPTERSLEKGDLIIKEIESSVIGYRAQQLRPLAVHECDPMITELSKLHAELYDEIL